MSLFDRFFPRRDRFAAGAFDKLSEDELAQVDGELAEREAGFAETLDASAAAISRAEALYHGGLSGAPTFEELAKMRSDRDAVERERGGIASARSALAIERARRATAADVSRRADLREAREQQIRAYGEACETLDAALVAFCAAFAAAERARVEMVATFPRAEQQALPPIATNRGLYGEIEVWLAARSNAMFGKLPGLISAYELTETRPSIADEARSLLVLSDGIAERAEA